MSQIKSEGRAKREDKEREKRGGSEKFGDGIRNKQEFKGFSFWVERGVS